MHSFANLFIKLSGLIWESRNLSYRQHFLAVTGFLRSPKRSWKLFFKYEAQVDDIYTYILE